MTQKLADSGQRRQFPGGAVRDRGDLKPRPDLISPHAQMREGMILTLGAEKYDTRNWELGMPLSECLASAQRHIEQEKLGMTDEDHAAQARVNLGFYLHIQEEVRHGGLDPKWDDMPNYVDRWKNGPTALVAPEDVLLELVGDSSPQVLLPVRPDLGEKDDQGRILVKWGDGPTARSQRFDHVRMTGNYLDDWVAYTDCATRKEEWFFKCPYSFDCTGIPKGGTDSWGSTCYVAGPMRGYEKFNFPTFDLARDLWLEAGWNVESPADMDREKNGFNEDQSPSEFTLELAVEVMARDCSTILGFDPRRGDCLVVLPGWENSKGAAVEVALARFLGLPVVQAFNGEVVKA